MLDASSLDIIRTHNVFKCPVTAISAALTQADSGLLSPRRRRVLDEERVLASLRTGSGACVIAVDFGRDAKRPVSVQDAGDDGVVDYWRLDRAADAAVVRVEDPPGSEPWAWRAAAKGGAWRRT